AFYWAILLLQTALMLLLPAQRKAALLSRRLYTFMVAFTTIAALRGARVVARRKQQQAQRSTSNRPSAVGTAETAAVDEWWLFVHRLIAPFLLQSILQLRGVWTKCGQYLSSRADVMPAAFVRELSKLQDSVPPSPFEAVRRTIEAELGKPVAELFGTLDQTALASASIAQVRGSPLLQQEVVVKVQHPEVRTLLLEDLSNLRKIVRFVAWCDGDFDFRPILDEWVSEATKELDFVKEAENLVRVGRAMHASGLEVVIPEVLPQFTTTRVLVMTFCEGIKVTEAAPLLRGGGNGGLALVLDRPELMRTVCEAFAYQIHVDGLFNADPHPGNILLQDFVDRSGVRRVRPVLLDWGLAKVLPEHLRLAFCRFVYAASTMDFVSMLRSFEEMGVKLNRFDPAEDMRNIRFLLRDTAPPDEARRKIKSFHRGLHKKMAKQRPPVDAYPGELLFFLRVTELLHGLGSRLHVHLSYLQVMAPYARRALIDLVPTAERCQSAVWPSPSLSPLEDKLRALLAEMVASGEVLGCQLVVHFKGSRLAELCAGQQGTVDPRPVTPRTLFCCFSVSKAVTATALHLLVDAGAVGYDTPVAAVWPEFGRHGKEGITVRHVLTHSTGLQHALPAAPSVEALADWPGMLQVLEEAEPLWPPGTKSCYHYFTFGWLVGGIVEKDAGRWRLSDFLRRRIFAPLGVGDEAFLGDIRREAVDDSRIATVEH
ncbi:unnamed protein product, partial [Phaeothamnion confervicola]